MIILIFFFSLYKVDPTWKIWYKVVLYIQVLRYRAYCWKNNLISNMEWTCYAYYKNGSNLQCYILFLIIKSIMVVLIDLEGMINVLLNTLFCMYVYLKWMALSIFSFYTYTSTKMWIYHSYPYPDISTD